MQCQASKKPSDANQFRRGRLGMGWTQDALARTIGVPLGTLHAWENDELAIPLDALAWVILYVRNPVAGEPDDELSVPEMAA
jgi:DNA-binding transcriptional regulator YiaG